jgi:energy-coupling factor transport system substrate-specific component
VQKNTVVFALVLGALGVAANVVLGTVVSSLKIPLLFLDTVGTIFIAAFLGPFWGALTGATTNVLLGIVTNPKDIPFALVNLVIGLIVGFVARKSGFGFVTAFWTGLVLAVIAPLIGTPIAVWIYGGLTGGGMDLIFAWLRQAGNSIFTAAFLPRIAGNLVDKVASALLVAALLQKLPQPLKSKVKNQIAQG